MSVEGRAEHIREGKVDMRALIKGYMDERGYNRDKIGEKLGISGRAFDDRLKDMTFSFQEILSLSYVLAFNPEFTKIILLKSKKPERGKPCVRT